MRKQYGIFKDLNIQKRIVSTETIRGNTVCAFQSMKKHLKYIPICFFSFLPFIPVLYRTGPYLRMFETAFPIVLGLF